jgi:hypothetical protein
MEKGVRRFNGDVLASPLFARSTLEAGLAVE